MENCFDKCIESVKRQDHPPQFYQELSACFMLCKQSKIFHGFMGVNIQDEREARAEEMRALKE